MQSGAYKQKITFQKFSVVDDEIGNRISQWKDYRGCYCYANGLSGREYWEAAAVQQETIIEFVMRWKLFFNHLNSKEYRIVFENNVYDIESIDNIQFKNKTVKIRAKFKGNQHDIK